MTPRNPARETIADEPIAVMRVMGSDPMPWQRDLFEVAFEVDASGLLWYREIVVVIMRQSGKSTIVIPWGVHRMIGWGERQFLLYIAQTRDKAREKLLEEHFFHINRSPLRRLLVPNRSGKILPVMVNGSEHLKFTNGSKWSIDAPTEDAGHGGTLGLTVGDEIFALRDSRLESALMPATAAVDDAQSLWISTPGESKTKSPFLWGKVSKGRSRVELARADPTQLDRSRSLYVEFSFADDEDPYDPMTWWRRMPALGFTQTLEKIQSFADSMGEAEFRRAFGCQWGDDFASDWKIPREAWEASRDVDSTIADDQLVYVFDVAPDSAWASISVAGVRDDGRIHVEVISDGLGTDWLVDGDPSRGLVGMRDIHAADPGDIWYEHKFAGFVVPRMRDAGLEPQPIPAQDIAISGPALLDLVLNDQIRQLGQQELEEQIASAATRVSGDVWRWARGKSMRAITGLTSVSHAAQILTRTLPELAYDPLAALRIANGLTKKEAA
ncbi:MAG: hypothetical protein J0I33_00075 [Microbacterium ginsengisoli]|uniref:terminase large subunit n=2 Tax=Microbacteriaceae TaxID=85023 RepID=UPI0012E3C786|nr:MULTISPECIES: terminase large subunit [unclassified Microbacterium]MBN9197029.1 hypothetical protein [Microbacterium ginsengisoli]